MTSLTASMKGSRVQLAGLHKPHRRTKDGVTLHVYAWRGKGAPKLGEYTADTLAAAHAKAAADSAGIAERYASSRLRVPTAKYVAGLIAEYKGSSDWTRLAKTTKVIWKMWLERIDEVWGDQKLSLFAEVGIRRRLIIWRDHYAEKSGARSADYGMQVMSRLLSFAVDREYLGKNPATGIGRIYTADRSDLIWSDEQIQAACEAAPSHVAVAIELAALTGLRISDLAVLKWSEIGPEEGAKATSKSGGRTTAHIPLTPALKALLARIPRHGDIILTTSHGKPWSCGATLSKAIQVAASAAGVDRRTHDLRGTAATRYCLAGLTNEEVADAMGWEEANVARMRKIYVSRSAVRESVSRKLAAFTAPESPLA